MKIPYLNKIKSFFKTDKHLNNKLVQSKELIYVDKFGNKWYTFKDIAMITMDRFLELQKAERYFKLKIDEHNAKRLIDVCLKYAKESEFQKVIAYLSEMRARLDFKAERKVYLDYCSIVYLINDEPLDHYEHDYFQTKTKLLEENSDIQNFFLRDVVKRYITCPFNSIQHFQQYLDQVDMVTEIMNQKVEVMTKN